MRLYIFRFIVFILMLNLPLYAGDGRTSGFEFLRTDFSPRTAAMSRSFQTIRGDIGTVFTNPAGMIFSESQQFAFYYSNYLLDINGGLAGYARPIQGLGVMTIAVVYFDYGTMDATNEFAEKTGTFSAYDLALSAGLSNHLGGNFSYGINLKYAFSKLENYNASAIAADFGLLYNVPFDQNMYLGVTLLNVGTNFETYAGSKEPLPLSLNVGISKTLAHLPLEWAISLKDLNEPRDDFWDYFKEFSIGGEFRISEALRLRLGYNNGLNHDLKANNTQRFGGLSLGLGIKWAKYRLDYSYSNYGTLGSIHRIGIKGSL